MCGVDMCIVCSWHEGKGTFVCSWQLKKKWGLWNSGLQGGKVSLRTEPGSPQTPLTNRPGTELHNHGWKQEFGGDKTSDLLKHIQISQMEAQLCTSCCENQFSALWDLPFEHMGDLPAHSFPSENIHLIPVCFRRIYLLEGWAFSAINQWEGVGLRKGHQWALKARSVSPGLVLLPLFFGESKVAWGCSQSC